MRWRIRLRRRRKVSATSVTKHYLEHKAAARRVVLERLGHFNQYYQFQYNRVAIRNQRRCWGSCSSKNNLNFNYKILFLEPELRDYIIVHELCHLAEMNHGSAFWQLVEKQIPSYRACVQALRSLDAQGLRATQLEKRAQLFQTQPEFYQLRNSDTLHSV